MNPKELKNNGEVFQYLTDLGARLKATGRNDLAQVVLHASKFASGSASEFLHEAQLALTRVLQAGAGSPGEQSEVRAVIAQIHQAFQKVGGA